jgi:DNA (cytosine-5)-methyltransferase 1
MRHGSLFSGIGGFDLAAEWMGWENVFHCEINDFARKVVSYHYPKAHSYTDITKTDFTKYEGTIDLISGGFPCQPFSLAGQRRGSEDERYLWHEMLRAVQEIKPIWVVAENVYGLINIDGGLVFDQVCSDLETNGYEVQPFVIAACAKDAPHRRERVWFVAYSERNDNRRRRYGETGRTEREGESKGQQRERVWKEPTRTGEEGTPPNTVSKRQSRQREVERPVSPKTDKDGKASGTNYNNEGNRLPTNWDKFPTQSPICLGDDGIPSQLDGISFSKWTRESLKAYGNAIVPQVAFEIFKAISGTKC